MRRNGRAVVLGGSVAGLCAAGAAAGHFDEVLVLERDTLPPDAQHRRGVPQSKHPHFLLNSGRRALGELFPGFEEALVAAGGMLMMPSMIAAHCEGGGWVPRKKSSMTMVFSSRVLIERVLRDFVRELPNVTIREDVGVAGLDTVGGGQPAGRVTGVRLAGDEEEVIAADLVIDAMGRGSSVADWLQDAGWPEVPTRTLDAKVTYTSRWYQKPVELPENWWWQQLSVLPTTAREPHPAEHDYLCQVFPIEGDRVIVTMGSWGHDMPRKNDDFVAAAERTRTPSFAQAMHLCEPLSDVFLTRSTGNKWRRYDLLRQPPLGLVAVGDSVCAFNPLYAQGISSAGRSAVLLAEHLGRADALDAGFFRDFSQAQRTSLDVPWTLALARDQGYENATGTETAPRWRRWLVGRYSWNVFSLISAGSREDAVIEEHFSKVFNLDESIRDMGRDPRVISGLVRQAIKQWLGRTKLPIGFDPRLEPPSDDYTDFANGTGPMPASGVAARAG